MAETMAPVPAPGGLLAPSLEDSRWAFTPKDDSAVEFAFPSSFPRAVTLSTTLKNKDDSAVFFMRKNKDDSAVEFVGNKAAVEFVGNKAAVAGSGLQKSASWSNFSKAAEQAKMEAAEQAKMEAAEQAKMEAAKQAKMEAAKQAVVAKMEAAKQERKAKEAAAEGRAKQAAAKVEGKAGPMALGAKVEGKVEAVALGRVRLPDPVVISSGIERLDEDFIQRVRNRRVVKAPGPIPGLCTKELEAILNEIEDVFMDIVRQHDEKGYAVMRVEHLDNGRKKMYRLSEEEAAQNILV